MKNIISNLAEAETLINQIAEYDYEGMVSIICMLIDTASAKYHIPVEEIVDLITTLVKEVNAELDAYSIQA